MKLTIFLFFLISISMCQSNIEENLLIDESIQIVILVHPYNKFKELPYLLSSIEKQNYTKSRINVLIFTEIFNCVNLRNYDKSIDRYKYNDLTIRILRKWKETVELEYHNFDLKINLIDDDEDSKIIDYWSVNRYTKIMNYKFEAFNDAIKNWADYCVLIDSDVIITNFNLFKNVIKNNRKNSIFAPMLYSLNAYSNFWAGIDENGYYKRTDDYLPILERQKIGSISVPMINSFIFINLRNKNIKNLVFKVNSNEIPFDDLIIFAQSAKKQNISLFIDNFEIYGYILPPKTNLNYNDQLQDLIDLEIDMLSETNKLFYITNELKQYQYRKPEKNKLNQDKIYVINLERRIKRKKYMQTACYLLSLECEFIKAVDGKNLNKQYLIENKINTLKGYLDPYHKRSMTFGEIGCFMSHYNIWLDVLKNNYESVIVFEDDVHFEKSFNIKFSKLIDSLKNIDYDFLYLGRKREGEAKKEKWLNDLSVYPTYSYWTIGYVIKLSGVKKLLKNKPLDKMIPVDEFLPIMYNQHPNSNWSEHFSNKNLIALSSNPLLIQPLHYVGDDNYISDTEDSKKLNENESLNNQKIVEKTEL